MKKTEREQQLRKEYEDKKQERATKFQVRKGDPWDPWPLFNPSAGALGRPCFSQCMSRTCINLHDSCKTSAKQDGGGTAPAVGGFGIKHSTCVNHRCPAVSCCALLWFAAKQPVREEPGGDSGRREAEAGVLTVRCHLERQGHAQREGRQPRLRIRLLCRPRGGHQGNHRGQRYATVSLKPVPGDQCTG